MKLSAVLVAALAASTNAIVAFTNSAFVVVPGKPFTLTWSGASGPVTIKLKNGPALVLKDVLTVDSSDTGSSFTWTPPSTLPSDTYAFEITDSTGVPNYSVQFQYFATASASTSTSGSTTSTTTTSGSTSTTTSGATTSSSSSSHSSTSSSTRTSSTSASTTRASATTTPANSNDSLRTKSPLALVLVAVVALLYFN